MVDNQHKKITGYRDLTEVEIADMNKIKALAEQVGELCEDLRVAGNLDQRWVSIGTTQLQQGFMALTRSIAKPTTF
jgi:flagellar biosynthesis/type III secretory pathway chaperone